MTAVPAVLVSGAPATGKSTVGRAFAELLGAALIDQDVATGPLVDVVAGLIGVPDLDHPQLAGLTRTARYEVVTALAEDNLRCGVPVVLVAPFSAERSSPAAWAALRDRLTAAGGVPLLAWLHLDPAQALHRLRERAAPRDAAKLADARAFLATVPGPPAIPHLPLDAALPPATLAAQLRAALP